MNRLTISLEEDLVTLLKREAARQDISVSQLVRDVLRGALEPGPGSRRTLPFRALGRSGRRHTARRAEQILDREWGRRG